MKVNFPAKGYMYCSDRHPFLIENDSMIFQLDIKFLLPKDPQQNHYEQHNTSLQYIGSQRRRELKATYVPCNDCCEENALKSVDPLDADCENWTEFWENASN